MASHTVLTPLSAAARVLSEWWLGIWHDDQWQLQVLDLREKNCSSKIIVSQLPFQRLSSSQVATFNSCESAR